MNKKRKKIKPFFTIITPSKNSKNDLKKTILSLKQQKFKNFEHIIIDSNSVDGTAKIFKRNKNNT